MPSGGGEDTCDTHWEEPRLFDNGDVDRTSSTVMMVDATCFR